MMKIAPILLLLALAACTYTPSYTGIHCGPDDSCPKGYSCIQEQCFLDTSEPSGEEPAEEIGQDGDAGADDAGVVDGDDMDMEDGADDADACGGCPSGQYCDEIEIRCKLCENPSHCGIDCRPCAQDEICASMGGTFCCFPPCSQDNACELVPCGARDYVCKAFFNPELRYDWSPANQNPPHFCRLSDTQGPNLDTLRCNDGNNLQYDCPWDGHCESGQCVHNPNVERLHPCGAAFGCAGDQQSGYCRMHRKDGESCDFNYDCESFCCTQDNNAVCIAYNASQCKIHTTLYWDFLDYFTWFAKGTSDMHNIDEWTYQTDDHGTKCTGDSDCDSGLCQHFSIAGENRCDFDGCVNIPEASGIRSSYFCSDEDHTQHMIFVTNQNPIPQPDVCPE